MWIKFTDTRPELNQPCIVVWEDATRPWMATYFGDEWITSAGYTIKTQAPYNMKHPLYWMPIPKMPGENE